MLSGNSKDTNQLGARDLTYRDGYIIQPGLRRRDSDDYRSMLLRAFARVSGDPFETLGIYDGFLLPFPAGDQARSACYIQDIVIKSPGKNDHSLPDQLTYLAPLIEQIATHENTYGFPLRSTVGLLTLRSIDLRIGEGVMPQYWHLPLERTPEQVRETMFLFDTPPETEFWIRKARSNALISEYVVTDPMGMRVQTDCLQVDDLRALSQGAIMIDPDFDFRVSAGNEILHGSNFSFRAGITATNEHDGQKQGCLQISYIPVMP